MEAIQIHEVGGPDKLTLDELDLPDPGPAQVRLRIEATGVMRLPTQPGPIRIWGAVARLESF
jgi:NADPH:quinone reductase-like Zn-dependent oxidoreductase